MLQLAVAVIALAQGLCQKLHIPFAQGFQMHAVGHEHLDIAALAISQKLQQRIHERRIFMQLSLPAIGIHLTRTAQKFLNIAAQSRHRHQTGVSHHAEASADTLLDIEFFPAELLRQLQQRRLLDVSTQIRNHRAIQLDILILAEHIIKISERRNSFQRRARFRNRHQHHAQRSAKLVIALAQSLHLENQAVAIDRIHIISRKINAWLALAQRRIGIPMTAAKAVEQHLVAQIRAAHAQENHYVIMTQTLAVAQQLDNRRLRIRIALFYIRHPRKINMLRRAVLRQMRLRKACFTQLRYCGISSSACTRQRLLDLFLRQASFTQHIRKVKYDTARHSNIVAHFKYPPYLFKHQQLKHYLSKSYVISITLYMIIFYHIYIKSTIFYSDKYLL